MLGRAFFSQRDVKRYLSAVHTASFPSVLQDGARNDHVLRVATTVQYAVAHASTRLSTALDALLSKQLVRAGAVGLQAC